MTQPRTHADGNAPHTLLPIAERDGIIDPGNSLRLAARLSGLGRPVVGALAVPLRERAPVRSDVLSFLRGLPAQFSRRTLEPPEGYIVTSGTMRY